jgi:hypothetical protein
MIKDKSRAGWFGASDSATIMGNWETDTFAKWWNVKLGLSENNFQNQYTAAGTAYEHKILDHLGIKGRDRQIRIKKIGKYRVRLRVNLDGEDDIIHEVKTHKSPKFTVSKAYWQQAQVEMYATGKGLVIESYRLNEADYDNFFRDIDPTRLGRHPVPYDKRWVEYEYLPRLIYLSKCMKERCFPCKADFAIFRSELRIESKRSQSSSTRTSEQDTTS